MFRLRCAVLALFVVFPVEAAGPELIDIVPANALQFIGITDIKSFSEKLDKVIIGVDPTQAGVAVFFGMAVNQLGLGTALDREAPLAFVMANPQDVIGKPLAINPNNGDEFAKLVVGSLGYLDDAKLARDLGVDPQVIQPDKVFSWKTMNFPTNMKALVKDRRLYIGTEDKALLSVSKAARLRSILSKEQVATLRRCDLLYLVNAESLADAWKTGIASLQQVLPAQREILANLNDLRQITVGVRLEDGIEGHAMALFAKGSRGADLLAKLGRGGASSLAGIPQRGDLVLAQAASFLRGGAGGPGLLQGLLPVDQPALQETLTVLGKHLQAERLALYATKTPQAGQFAALAILDSEGPAGFLAEIARRIPAGKPGDLKFTEFAPVAGRPLIEQYIKDLGAEDFDTREKAAAQLLQSGRAALPLLEQAVKSPDLEIARRARDIVQEISLGAAGKRADLLSGRRIIEAPPTLFYFADAEKRRNLSVSVVQVRLDPKDAALIPKLRELLGPNWDKVRLVRHDRQIVVLLGSDTQLLDESLDLLSRKEPGLAKATLFKEFDARTHPDRMVEVHQSYVRLLTLFDVRLENRFKEEERQGATSIALATKAEQVQLDVWIPLTELRGIVYQVQQSNLLR